MIPVTLGAGNSLALTHQGIPVGVLWYGGEVTNHGDENLDGRELPDGGDR
jgi:hypothetical protein